ncbi:MAG: undecaprenyl-diphosphate phosphatase [Methylacidiphilales bacterium]|nr:undecaprenyl-diphosphate phosphatase [Candidatus Methylacidiphilales bacterium]MDW8348816.1 undecaprenyl-diphosphate phosphatase [Verrucomicrobiae bacterium]
MDNLLQLLILGLIEGVTEFLPISSTAHLLIAQHWIGPRSDAFNIIIQSGAILAVLLIYWKKILDLILNIQNPEKSNYLIKLITAFLLTCLMGYGIKKIGWTLPDTLAPIILSLLGGSLLILYGEYRYAQSKEKITDSITWPVVFAVALAQIFAAIFPGLSRSGAVILFAMLLHTSRPAATEFSFLLGIPTMFAASILSYYSETHHLTRPPQEPISDILIAFLIATVTAFIAVRWLLRYVQTHTLTPFAYYRIAIALILITLSY